GADPLLTLVSSLGVAVALVNVTQYLFGAEPYSFPDPLSELTSAVNFGTAGQPVLVRTVQVVIFGVSIVMLVLLTYLMNATRTGKALRAVAEDTTTSSLLGIDTDRLILLTFVISGFLGGVTGTLIGLSVGIAGPYFGIAFGLKGLAVVSCLPLMPGQLSVASPGFYALCGYVTAILSTKVFHPGPGLYPVSLVLIEMAVAAVVSGILGIAVGLPALRLRGIFLALA